MQAVLRPKAGRIAQFDTLRGVAAALSVLRHSTQTFARWIEDSWTGLPGHFDVGRRGVVPFFMISGTDDREREPHATVRGAPRDPVRASVEEAGNCAPRRRGRSVDRGRARVFRGIAVAVVAATASGSPSPAASPVTVAALPAGVTQGRGASVSFVEYEAETAQTNGTLLGPDRTFTTIAAEASGRKAIRLAGRGAYVAFTLARPANAMTVRYAIPDSAAGTGLDATLGIYVADRPAGVLKTTSRYGWFYGANPFTNRPSAGKPHHFFDEARFRFAHTLAAGTIVKLMVRQEDSAPWYAIDLADFELVPPPKSMPPGAEPVVAFGADPSGARSSTAAFVAAIAAGRARHRPLWIPPGLFRIDQHLVVDHVTLRGAGPWYSVLQGKGVGIYGRYPPTPSQGVILRDFAIIGEVTDRNGQAPLSGVGGAMGGGSQISDLWIQHEETGIWFDGPVDGVIVSGVRILDTTADGINFRRGVSHAVVRGSFIRNTGDDGLAMWSRFDADHDNAFVHNTVIAPILANGIAIYGGRQITVSDNVVADTLTEGGGIHVGNRFNAVPVSGDIAIAGNVIIRGGGSAPPWPTGIAALWFYALDAAIAARVRVSALTIIDSTADAIQIKGKAVDGLSIIGLTASGGGHLLAIQAPGEALFRRVHATGMALGAVTGCRDDFTIRDRGENRGWMAGACRARRP